MFMVIEAFVYLCVHLFGLTCDSSLDTTLVLRSGSNCVSCLTCLKESVWFGLGFVSSLVTGVSGL
jgi:hypothetical protein